VATPIYDTMILQKVKKFLEIQLNDTVKARMHNPNMSNARHNPPSRSKSKSIRSQVDIYQWLADDYKTKKAGK
jgi:polyphosphate kinase